MNSLLINNFILNTAVYRSKYELSYGWPKTNPVSAQGHGRTNQKPGNWNTETADREKKPSGLPP